MEYKPHASASYAFILSMLLFLLLFLTVYSFSIGRYTIHTKEILEYVIFGKYNDVNIPTLISNIRLPRILGAILAGGALSVSGAAYQGLFRNPMVSPDILGVSSGAGFGASLAILFSFSMVGIQISAFCMGLLSVCLSLSICKITGSSRNKILMLVLSGMIVGSTFSALISLMKYVADSEYKLPDITFWLMGSLNEITMAEIRFILPVVGITLIPLYFASWKLNVLSFGEEEAKSLGVNTRRLRVVIVCCASLLTASVICVTGLIGWVGLIIPHFTRFLIGPNHKWLMPGSFLMGGIFMLAVDDITRSAFALEIPLGIITSLIGAPVFFIILKISSKQTW